VTRFWIGCLFVGALGFAASLTGCASAERDTMVAELGLSSSLSLGYKTIDGIDQVRTEAIHTEFVAGQVTKAKADYSAYKPQIEKARAALNTANDTLENAERIRAAIPTGGAVDAYAAWLPALTAAYATVVQAVTDVKGLLP
jgi:hypothetical protein